MSDDALAEESVLQNASRTTNRDRSGSWTFEAPPGAYGLVVAWHSGEAWFDSLMDALTTNAGEEKRRRARVARDTLLRVARADWLAADVTTGRGLATAHETVAAELGMSSKTVQRSRLLMEDLGFAVTIVEGRYLTLAERRAARETHGGRQIKAASLRALTTPRPSRPVENVHLPSVKTFNPSSLVKKNSPKRADARRTVASLPQPKKKRNVQRQIPASAEGREHPRSLRLQKLAATLVRRVRWLDTGRHLGALCRVLESVGVDGEQWSASDVIEAMDRAMKQRNMSYPDHARNPLGFVRWALSLVVEPTAMTPAQERARIETERRERIARQAQERAAERARVAAIDREEVARIIAASNAEIAARQREARLRRAETRE